MAFKTDYSFLDKLTMGAVGNSKAIELLNDLGHEIIELERYSTHNKIWSTKIKRLRVPDLLCLKCGIRFESRAKSKLGIIMSDSPNNKVRHWDSGLRDEDVVVFIYCKKNNESNQWEASNSINMFKIKDLRSTINLSKLGPPKSQSEGAERDRRWPAYTPGITGCIEEVIDSKIIMRKNNGKKQSYGLKNSWVCYLKQDESFKEGESIIASVVPNKYSGICKSVGNKYHSFREELYTGERETEYAAIKALGYIPDNEQNDIEELNNILKSSTDDFIKLEAAGTLTKLNKDNGLQYIESIIGEHLDDELGMEGILILSEINSDKSLEILTNVIHMEEAPVEIRAAAIWGMMNYGDSDRVVNELLVNTYSCDIEVAGHSIVVLSRHLNEDIVNKLLREIDDNSNKAAAIEYILLKHAKDYLPIIIKYLMTEANKNQEKWIIHMLGIIGEVNCKVQLLEYGDDGRRIINMLDLFWNIHNKNWTFNLDVADRLRFISYQW
jgi:hypothetical protein